MVYILNTFIIGIVDVYSYWFPHAKGNSQEAVLLFPVALVASPLPLPRPTGVKSTHSTGHIFPGSSDVCWHEVPFKAPPGSLCG